MKKLLSIAFLLLLAPAAWAITPQAPLSTAATIKGPDVVITWSPPAANTDGTKPAKVAGYNVYRSTTATIQTQGAGGAVPLAGGPGNGIIAPTSTYTDKGASAGKYFYAVSAWYCDPTAGCAEGALSNITAINQPTTPAPPPPASTAVPVTSTVALSWSPPTANTDGSALTDLTTYNIYQGTSASSMTKVATAGAASSSYVTGPLQPGTYYFTVSAVNSVGQESSKSAVVSSVIPPPPVRQPGQPANVKITVIVTAG